MFLHLKTKASGGEIEHFVMLLLQTTYCNFILIIAIEAMQKRFPQVKGYYIMVKTCCTF